MTRLDACLSTCLSKVQALTPGMLVSIPISLYGTPQEFPSYVSLVSSSKPIWILATFLTYSFYPLTHCTKICHSISRFIHVIILGLQFNIKQVIIDTITHLHDYSFRRRGLPIGLIISRLLNPVGFIKKIKIINK